MRTPVEPGATVDDVPSRRGAPPPLKKDKTTPRPNQESQKGSEKTKSNQSSQRNEIDPPIGFV